MSAELLARGVVTDALVELLEGSTLLADRGVLVGDGVTPNAAGWPGGKVGSGSYVASVTVSTAEATPRDADTGRHRSWTARYGLTSRGAARSQADAASDAARAECLKMHGVSLPAGTAGSNFKVIDVVFARLAPVTPSLATDPPTWLVADLVELWLERERT